MFFPTGSGPVAPVGSRGLRCSQCGLHGLRYRFAGLCPSCMSALVDVALRRYKKSGVIHPPASYPASSYIRATFVVSEEEKLDDDA